MKIKYIIEGVSFRENPFRVMDTDGIIIIKKNDFLIKDSAIDLESWFNVLIDGFYALREGVLFYSADLITEPDEVKFQLKDDIYTIKYKQDVVEFKNLEDYFTALLESSISIVNILKKINLDNNIDILKKVRSFIENESVSMKL